MKERGDRSVYVARGNLGFNNERKGRSIEIAMGQHRTLGESPGATGSLPSFLDLNSLGSAMGKRMGGGGEKYESMQNLGRIFPLANRVNGDILSWLHYSSSRVIAPV